MYDLFAGLVAPFAVIVNVAELTLTPVSQTAMTGSIPKGDGGNLQACPRPATSFFLRLTHCTAAVLRRSRRSILQRPYCQIHAS